MELNLSGKSPLQLHFDISRTSQRLLSMSSLFLQFTMKPSGRRSLHCWEGKIVIVIVAACTVVNFSWVVAFAFWKVWVTYGLFQGAIFQCTPFCKREAFAMVVVLKCFQCGSPFAEANLSCLQCRNRCYIDHDPPSEPSVFIHEWKDWTVKLLVRQIYRAKWTAYGAALKKIKSGKICTRTLCMSALGLLGDVWCQTNVRW